MKLNKLASHVLAYVLQQKFQVVVASCNLNQDFFQCDFLGNESISIKHFPRIEKDVNRFLDDKHSLKVKQMTKEAFGLLNKSNEFVTDILKTLEVSKVNVLSIDDKYYALTTLTESELDYKQIKSFKLDSIGGAYWLNNVDNKQLQRIHGFAFSTKEESDKFIIDLNERKERDHRKIGSEMELFSFDALVGQGLPIWLPKGTIVKTEVENFVHKTLEKQEYNFVQTPVLGSVNLYKVSGHWEHYRENMFKPIDIDGELFCLRPMTCPHHLLIYKQKPHSYRELPIRYAEHAILHRYESSGSLTGFERVRSMQLVDTHIVIRYDQIHEEVKHCFETIQMCLNGLGIKIHAIDLSLHDVNNTKKFFDDEQMWQEAEAKLENCLKVLNVQYERKVGEAAFYGPKIDIQIKTALEHIITISTIQLDFLLPSRFELKYIDKDGKQQMPLLIHGGIIGTFERFMAILLEQTKGVLPLWMSPVQVQIIPVTDVHVEHSNKLKKLFISNDIRAKIDDSFERVGKKIRNAQISKIPYQIVIGDDEIDNSLINYRVYGSDKTVLINFDKFIEMLKSQIKDKK